MLGITVVALVTAILLALPYLRPSPQGQGQVPQTHTFQLHVIPANARVTMDDQPLEVDAAGRASFQRLSSESVRLAVSKDPEYQEERRQIALSDHLDREIEVRLKHRPDFLMRRALESWRGGDASGALDDAVAAIEQDGAFAVFPAPLYRLSKGERRGIGRMSISPDGRWIVCGDQTGRVLVWDLQSSDRSFPALGIHKHDDAVESIAVGRQWVASADLAGQVQVSRLGSDLAPPQTLQLTENLVKLMITPDDHWLISGSDDGSGKYVLQRWDLQSSALPSTGVKLGEHGGMIDEILLPAGQATVITASWDRTVREWSLESPASAGQGRLLGQLTGDVYCLARVGDNIVFAGDGGNALEADANTAEPRYRRHRIVLVPLDGQACREFPEGHEEQIEALTSSASGRWLASGSVDGMVQVWEVVQQQPRGPVVLAGRHSSKINALSFDPSGQWLVSGGNEGNVVVWDVQNPAKSAVIGRHDGPVTQAIVLPDGSAVISCGEDGSVRQWDLPKCQLILRACDRLGIEPKPYAEPKDQVEA
jgi:WD40 repeat protein